MQKEIVYKGFTENPSDYECPDGELASALGMVPEDSTMKPILPPKEMFDFVPSIMLSFMLEDNRVYLDYFRDKQNDKPGGDHPICWSREDTDNKYYTDKENPEAYVDYAYDNYDEGNSLRVEQFLPSELYQIMLIHKGVGYVNYIVRNGARLMRYYYNENHQIQRTDLVSYLDDIIEVNSIGNTLIVLTKGGMYYYLWKNDDTAYSYLGDHLPEIGLSFGLQGHPRLYSYHDSSRAQFTIEFEGMTGESIYREFSEENKMRITNQIMAKVNKFLTEQATNKGRFAFPFLVRYALRLYDGTLTMHSAPVLMCPCTTNNPIVYWTSAHGESDTLTSATCDMMIVAADLDYQYVPILSDDIGNWGDIVKSVDIFISKPIYPYDQNGKIQSCKDVDNFDSVFVGKIAATGYSGNIGEEDKYLNDALTNVSTFYGQWTYAEIAALFFPRTGNVRDLSRKIPGDAVFKLPEYDTTKIGETIRNTSNFYYLSSIPLEELSQTRTLINTKEKGLDALVAHEVMSDDYLSHDNTFPKFSYAYNGRLNMAGISRELFKGFNLYTMLAYCNRRFNFTTSWVWIDTNESSGDPIYDGETLNPDYNPDDPNSKMYHRRWWDHVEITPQDALADKFSVKVNIRENGEEKVVVCNGYYAPSWLQNFLSDTHTVVNPKTGDSRTETSKESWGNYLFYPNPNAYKMTIVTLGVSVWNPHGGKKYEIKLLPHDYLNGAYAFLDFGTERPNGGRYDGDTSDQTDYLYVSNKIYTSEINNPFFFPVSGVNTVGTGTIINISSAAKALSEGQFGQFPLYVFTDEGVWALELSDTGTYKARQPITRDVCINSDSITQIDSAVLFATDRGIMMISGSNTICISDELTANNSFDSKKLPNLYKVLSDYAKENNITYVPFLDYVKGCRMIYDYVHQRIIVFNPEHSYAYVYSLKSKKWGMMYSTIAGTVNSYPNALAVTDDGTIRTVVDYSEDGLTGSETEGLKGVIITRPIKLDEPDTLKTVNTVITRGKFKKGHVKTILYGSRDLENWHLIASSVDNTLRYLHGTPYKYFRIVLLCDLDKGESIISSTVEYTSKYANQIR